MGIHFEHDTYVGGGSQRLDVKMPERRRRTFTHSTTGVRFVVRGYIFTFVGTDAGSKEIESSTREWNDVSVGCVLGSDRTDSQ